MSSFEAIVLGLVQGLTEFLPVSSSADLIIVPVIPSPLSMRALAEVESHLGRKAAPLMPVHSMVDRRRNLHIEALAAQPDWPVIPMASVVETMAVQHRPVGAFAPRSPGAQAFAELWQAIERRLAFTR